MRTWYYYVKDDGTAYWTTMHPCYGLGGRYLASIDSAEIPSTNPTVLAQNAGYGFCFDQGQKARGEDPK